MLGNFKKNTMFNSFVKLLKTSLVVGLLQESRRTSESNVPLFQAHLKPLLAAKKEIFCLGATE